MGACDEPVGTRLEGALAGATTAAEAVLEGRSAAAVAAAGGATFNFQQGAPPGRAPLPRPSLPTTVPVDAPSIITGVGGLGLAQDSGGDLQQAAASGGGAPAPRAARSRAAKAPAQG